MVDTTYARMRGHPLASSGRRDGADRWSLAFNLPAGVYEVGIMSANISGGYHEYQSRACIVTVGDDPRVKGDSFVALRLEAHRTDASARARDRFARRRAALILACARVRQ